MGKMPPAAVCSEQEALRSARNRGAFKPAVGHSSCSTSRPTYSLFAYARIASLTEKRCPLVPHQQKDERDSGVLNAMLLGPLSAATSLAALRLSQGAERQLLSSSLMSVSASFGGLRQLALLHMMRVLQASVRRLV